MFLSQSETQSLREREAAASDDCCPPTRANAGGWFSDASAAGVEATEVTWDDPGGGGEDPRNVEERGANVIVSV